jgi:tetratricopeptide (TPR) repeat protein
MKNLTRSFNTILALALVAAAGGGCTKAARANRAANSADRFFQAGKYAEAEAAYSNACRLVYPPNPKALRQLGLVYVQEGRSLAALGCLLEAAKSEPDNAQIQIELAANWAAVGQPVKAREAARLALKLKPGDEKALMALCDTIPGPEEAEQTRHYVEQLQKLDQDRASYHLALGMIDAHETNMVAAETELNTARKLDPKSSLVYIGLAKLSTFHNNLKGADEAYKTAVELAPLRSMARINYAEFLAQTGATNQARTNMMELIRQAPDYLPPLIFMMKFCFVGRQFGECNSFISQVLDHEPNNYEALLLRANVSLEKKDGKQAVADFARLFAMNPKITRPQDQYQLAQAYMLSGDRPKAIASLNRSLELDTNYNPAKLVLAELDTQQGNSAAAISMLAPLLKQTNLSQAVLVPASLILAQAYLVQKSPAQAIAIYRGMEQTYPREAQISFLEGRAWSSEKNLAEARAAFERSFAINADFLPSLQALVDLDLAKSNYVAALERVNKQMVKNTNAPALLLLQARIHMQQKENAQAQADLEKIIAMDPKLPDSYLMLARLFVSQNQQKQALDKLNTLITLTNDISALTEIGVIHQQLKEYDEARQAYEEVLAVDPQSLIALDNLAGLYSYPFKKLDEAYQLAEKGRQLAPQDPSVGDTLGWILYQKHDYSRALALLQESAEKLPNSGEVQYHLGMAHYMLGEEESSRLNLKSAISRSDFESTNEALRRLKILDLDPKTATAADREDLEKQIEKDSADPMALIRLAALQERDGDFQKAGASYEKVIKISPDNARAMIRLALLDSTKLNQTQKGLELAKNAHNLAPTDPYTTEVLGRLVFQAGDFPYALSLLQSAARLLPAQPDLLHDLAWAHFSVGDVAQARSSMLGAIQTGVPFDKLNDAKQFLEMVTAYSNPAQAQVATRVQQILQADANYAPALMASGLIQEQQGQGKQAELSYEKVLAAYPLFAPALRQLSFLYSRDANNDAKAYDCAVKAAQALPEDADLAKLVGMMDYRRKNYSKSLQSLTQSARNKTGDAELLWYQGMDYYALKQPAEAKKALQQAVNLKLPADLDTEARRVLGLLK